MPIYYEEGCAIIEGDCTVEEAEPLLTWLRTQAEPRVNLMACGHPHTAVLQALLLLRPLCEAAPADPLLAGIFVTLPSRAHKKDTDPT